MASAGNSKILDRLRTSFWFVPALMTVAAALVAFVTIYFDSHYQLKIPWIYAGDASGARTLLSMLAGSMITVAGVVFSITIVALSLASSQYGPRLLRNYLRDRVEQIVLGTFLATFTYSLLVLRTVRADPPEFVPHLSVTVSISLAMASLALLIYFIHHIAITIQAPVILAHVGAELRNVIIRVLPDEPANPPRWTIRRSIEDVIPEKFERESCPVRLTKGAYIQAIDERSLFEIACKGDLVIALRCRPGDFLTVHDEICRVWPRSHVSERTLSAIRRSIVLGQQRTVIQDVRFAIAELVEVGAIALSPGINEPFTAINCIHWLTDAFTLIAERNPANPYHFEDGHFLRVVYQELSMCELLDDAFDALRQMGAGMPMVMNALMDGYLRIGPQLRNQDDRNHLVDHAKRALDVAERNKQCENDVIKLRLIYGSILRSLKTFDGEVDEDRQYDRSIENLTGENRPEQ